MATKPKEADRGGVAEEAIREYFSNLGAFSIRGIPLKADKDDVSDVDIWAYTRVNAVSRSIAIIDIKNKKRGKPYERAIWVRGLQAALRSDEAFIATQGAKSSVYDFSHNIGVKVISGNLFDALVRKYSSVSERIFHEELDTLLKGEFVENRSVKDILDGAKSHLGFGITFSALNHWIDDAGILLKACIDREDGVGPISRACYLVLALVAIGVDYLSKTHAMSNVEMRAEYFRKGLIFGNGSDDGRRFIEFSEALVSEHLDSSGAGAAKIRAGFNRSIENMPIGGLVENFSRASSSAEMFRAAIQLERAAFRRDIQPPSAWETVEAKAIVGMISDYCGLPRRIVLGDRLSIKQDRNNEKSEADEEQKTSLENKLAPSHLQGKFDV